MYFLSRFTEITNMRHIKEMGGKKKLNTTEKEASAPQRIDSGQGAADGLNLAEIESTCRKKVYNFEVSSTTHESIFLLNN